MSVLQEGSTSTCFPTSTCLLPAGKKSKLVLDS